MHISTSENHSQDLTLLKYRYRTFTTVSYNTGLAQVRKQGFIGRYPSHTLYQFLPVITVIDCYCVLSYHRTVIRHIRSWILSLPQVIKPSCFTLYSSTTVQLTTSCHFNTSEYIMLYHIYVLGAPSIQLLLIVNTRLNNRTLPLTIILSQS